MIYWFFLTTDGTEFDVLGTARDHAIKTDGEVYRVTIHNGVITQRKIYSRALNSHQERTGLAS